MEAGDKTPTTSRRKSEEIHLQPRRRRTKKFVNDVLGAQISGVMNIFNILQPRARTPRTFFRGSKSGMCRKFALFAHACLRRLPAAQAAGRVSICMCGHGGCWVRPEPNWGAARPHVTLLRLLPVSTHVECFQARHVSCHISHTRYVKLLVFISAFKNVQKSI